MTNLIPLQAGAWTLVYSGPTTDQISVERPNYCGALWIAVSGASQPTFTRNGHLMAPGVTKLIELDTGENLYAWLAESLVGSSNSIIITD